MLLATLTAAVLSLAAPVQIPLPADGVGALAYADGRVLWETDTDAGPVVIHQAPAAGGPESVLATIPRTPNDLALVQLAANATGYVATVYEDARERVIRGGYDGSLQTLVDCAPSGPTNQMGLAAGTTGFAFFAPACGVPLATVGAGGAVAPVPGVALNTNAQVAYAEPYVAVSITKGTVRIFNLSDGTHRDLPRAFSDDGSHLALRPDGGLAIAPGVDIGRSETEPPGVYAWPPGAAEPTYLSPNVLALSDPFVSQEGVLLSTELPVDGQAALGLIPFAGGATTAVGAPGAGVPRIPVALEGSTAVFRSFGCDGRDQATVVDVTAPRADDTQYGCPVTLDRGDIGPKSVRVRCPNGCRADLRLADLSKDRKTCLEHPDIVQTDPPVCPVVAGAKLRLHASPSFQRVRLELTRVGRRHHGAIPVYARLTFAHNGPQLLGLEIRTLRRR